MDIFNRTSQWGRVYYNFSWKKSYKKAIRKSYRIEKVIKRRSNELYVKWKSYDNSFNSWVDKKDTSI